MRERRPAGLLLLACSLGTRRFALGIGEQRPLQPTACLPAGLLAQHFLARLQ